MRIRQILAAGVGVLCTMVLLAGCDGGNAQSHAYRGLAGTPATAASASDSTPAAAPNDAPAATPTGEGGTAATTPAPEVRRPLRPGDPGGATEEQLAVGVTPWDKAKARTAPAQGQPYLVGKGGESLYSISRKMLGSESRWKELYEANRGVIGDPNKVPAGTKIHLPVKQAAPRKFRGLTDGLD